MQGDNPKLPPSGWGFLPIRPVIYESTTVTATLDWIIHYTFIASTENMAAIVIIMMIVIKVIIIIMIIIIIIIIIIVIV